MQTKFFRCSKHTSYWRNKALRLYPWANAIAPVHGGYYLFENLAEYFTFLGQK